MLTVEWTLEKGWNNPIIHPYRDIKLAPSATVFHYGFCCFEGMKAYKDSKNNIRLFRPEMNMRRMNISASKIALPVRREFGLIIDLHILNRLHFTC